MNADEALARQRAVSPLSDTAVMRRRFLAHRDGGMRCAYCGAERTPDQLVLEHVVPRSLGGPDGLHNRVLSCPRCDREKGPRTPQEWRPGHTWGNRFIDQPTSARRQGANLESKQRRRLGLVRIDIAYCATCQKPVQRKQHPASHLVIDNGDHEPSSQET